MVVNSFSFLLFFIVVFLVYFAPGISQRKTWQNVWLLLASYFFYGFVDWRMLPFLFCITVVFFLLGRVIKTANVKGNIKAATRWKTLGVILGVGVLIYFKYLNFFADSVAALLNAIGLHASWTTLNIVLPVGVSFFTFKLISYVIEIHREKTEPADNLLEFATYIAFFPTMLSGPIDRPNTFLPQLRKNHTFNYNLAMDGCQQILWGIFTKMVIADNLAIITSEAWKISINDGAYLLYGALLSPIQVYADFDGYSNMAIGVGKILGFNITKNFNHPLLARNVSEYWNRWHISLTKWITDYVFMPLNIAFRNIGKWGLFLAITINLVVIGLWHGANWTYAVFGIFHSLLFIPIILSGNFGKNKKIKENKWGLPLAKDVMMMIVTYLLISVGHIIFFSPNVSAAVNYWSVILTDKWDLNTLHSGSCMLALLLSLVLVVIEWRTRKKEFAIQRTSHDYNEKLFRLIAMDLFLFLLIALLGFNGQQNFIYFKF